MEASLGNMTGSLDSKTDMAVTTFLALQSRRSTYQLTSSQPASALLQPQMQSR